MNQYLSLVLVLLCGIQTLSIVSGQQQPPIRTVSVYPSQLQKGPVNVYFVCPNIRERSDSVEFYRFGIGNRRELIKTKQPHYGFVISVKSMSDIGTYECDVVAADNSRRKAILKIVDGSTIQSLETIKYKAEKIQYIFADIGTAVKMSCKNYSTNRAFWFRPPQFVASKAIVLKIAKLTKYDYGVYHCTGDTIDKKSVNVNKIVIAPPGYPAMEKPIDREASYLFRFAPKSSEIRYRPSLLTYRTETVTWERPAGTILLDHGRDMYLQSSDASGKEDPFYYRVQNSGDMTVNKVGKVLIDTSTDKEEGVRIEGRMSLGSDMKIKCSQAELGHDVKVIWKRGDTIIHEGNVMVIKRLDKNSLTKYSCEVIRNGVQIRSRSVDLLPPDKVQSKIEMAPEPGKYFIFHKGDKQELHCEIDRINRKPEIKSEDIIWTFNGQIIDDENKKSVFGNINRFGKLNSLSVSILILRALDIDNEGTYKCFKNNKVLATNLLMEREKLLVEVAPELLTFVHDMGDIAEYHCRITSRGFNSSHLSWSFIPQKSGMTGDEINLLPEVEVQTPKMTPTTSFITIENVLKKHEGYYVCRAQNTKKFSRLIVTMKAELTVTPKVITVKPGSEASFLCELKGVNGKVIWRRKDRKTLVVGKENRMGGSTRSLLQIKKATLADHGTVYECAYNNLVEEAILYVKDDCALNKRKCKDGKCIDERKFCDGKDDCGDNSDEDPKRCNECSPNSMHCDFINGSDPTKRCIVKHWKCDGVDDCGNNFDELNCPVKNKEQCLGSHYQCDNDVLIPRSYWCDGEADCTSAEDEVGCTNPEVLEPRKTTKISVVNGTQLAITCKVSGRPVVTVSWRYNWAHLPDNLNYTITETVSNCSIITNTLTIHDIRPEHSGIFSCEAIARLRIMAPDFVITITQQQICKTPYFNHDAVTKEFCLDCHCSNRSNDCTSAIGYTLAEKPVVSSVVTSDGGISNLKTFKPVDGSSAMNFIDDKTKTYFIDAEKYSSIISTPDHFFGGTFNMDGSWLMSYGYALTFTIVASGNATGIYSGPLMAIMGGDGTNIYFCPPAYKLWVHPSEDNYDNKIRVLLWEKDFWYLSSTCTGSVSRAEFMTALTKVQSVLVRVKYFAGQTNFRMSAVSRELVVPSSTKYSWAARIELCRCPAGYSGLSCEIKN